MLPDPEFVGRSPRFWAHVRLIGQQVGYTQRRRRKRGQKAVATLKRPAMQEVVTALEALGLKTTHLASRSARPTKLGKDLLAYFEHRANALETQVEPNLMSKTAATKRFSELKRTMQPKCPIPLNKQRGEKKGPAYFTAIINMLIEANLKGLACNYDPRELTTITRNGQPFRTLSRRVDGAFPSALDPIAIWEIKEYYNTKTFGSRVADGVYESLLDGMELADLRKTPMAVKHYLMVDDHFTWWDCGRSYLCRIVDMLHMGYVDEVLFGAEVIDRLPVIVAEWRNTYLNRKRG